jgi:hypothetical protein
MGEEYTEPMTGVNSPFRQHDLDKATEILAGVGMTLPQAQEQLWRAWVKGGVPPLAWASAVANLVTLPAPGPLDPRIR